MDPLFQDERISAYLDGQMPPDERSQFEDEMARNGELRQVVEELRGLHESLQALPRQRLGDDFAEHVLRRAERAMLTDSRVGGSLVGANRADGSAAEEPHIVRAAISRIGRSRRPWIWAAVAIAVAVMLMVLNPPPNKHDKLVQSDAAPQAHAVPRADSLARDAQLHKSQESLHDRQLLVPAGGIAANASGNKRSGNFGSLATENGLSHSAGKSERSRSIAGQNGAVGKADVSAQSGSAPAANFDSRREVSKAAAPAASPAAAQHAASEIDSVAGGRLAKQGDVEFRQNGIQPAAAPEGAVGGQPQLFAGSVNQPSAKEANADADQADEAKRAPKRGLAENRGQSLQAQSLRHVPGESVKGEVLAGYMIVAEVEARSELSPAKLQQLLDKRGITLNNSPAALLALTSAVRRALTLDIAPGSAPSAASRSPVADAAAKEADVNAGAERPSAIFKGTNLPLPKSISQSATRAPTDALKLADSDREAQENQADRESLEVVYVVGTRQQVLGLVDDLHSQPEQYRTLAVTTVSPEATDGLEKDAKAPENHVVVDDRIAETKTDRDGDVARAARKLPQALAPAPPAAPAAALPIPLPTPLKPEPALADDEQSRGTDAPSATKKENTNRRGGGQASADKPGAVAAPAAAPIVAEQKAVEPAPAAEAPSPVAADIEAAAEPAERSNGLGWAAQMRLRPEAENLLRKSLAERENPVAADKARSDDQSKQKAAQRDSLGRSEGGGGGTPGDQVQAVLVFRLAPAK